MPTKTKTNPTLDDVKRKAAPILKRHGATKAGVFGSLARGKIRRQSDIDILVELGKDLSLLDVIGIELELEEALGRSVDLVEYQAIKPRIREQILAEEVRII